MRLFTLVSLLCFALCPCVAQDRIEHIDSILHTMESNDGFSGSVLISDHGKIVYEKSFGYSNAETRTPVTRDTLFLIGSVAKTFTAVALLKLKEQGRLELDDPITKFLPKLPYKHITLRHLLTHSSGLLEYQSEEVIKEISDKGVTNGELASVFVRLSPKLAFEPGSQWSYSNTNYILLALVVEKVSGETFPAFVKTQIFIPARMTRSFVSIKNVPQSLKSDVASGYRLTNPLAAAPVNVDTLEGARSAYSTKKNLVGSGNVYSTSRDLFKFHRALQYGKILGKQTLVEMYEPMRLSSGADYRPFVNTNYLSKDALGWFVSEGRKQKIVYHPGGDIGYVSYFLRNTTKDQSVTVLSNTELLRHNTPTAFMRILNGEPYKLDLSSLAVLLGKEYNRSGSEAMLKAFGHFGDGAKYTFLEEEMNELGLRLLYDKKDIPAAIEILKLITKKFPKSFNAWDSLGEAYHQAGNLEEAIKNYEISLQINPSSVGGKRMLEEIRGKMVKP